MRNIWTRRDDDENTISHIEDSYRNGDFEVEELTEQEIAAIDLRLGQEYAESAIALARSLHDTPARQARELRWWYGLAGAFLCHSPYSKPLLAAEINRLEESS